MPTSHHGRIGPAQWPFIGLSSPAPTGRVARGMCGFPCASASPAGNIRFRRLGLGSPSRGVSSSPAVRKDHRATLTYESAARQPDSSRVLSSGGERFLDAEEVRGSNPLAPTRFGSRNILTFLAHQLQEQERSRARHRTPRHRLQHQSDDLRPTPPPPPWRHRKDPGHEHVPDHVRRDPHRRLPTKLQDGLLGPLLSAAHQPPAPPSCATPSARSTGHSPTTFKGQDSAQPHENLPQILGLSPQEIQDTSPPNSDHSLPGLPRSPCATAPRRVPGPRNRDRGFDGRLPEDGAQTVT